MTFLAENALFKDIGDVFHPLFELFGLILAGIYAVIPNYTVAITGLTVVIMLALTPVTVKSTKSMLAMQRLQPEMKKLQAKFKGPENREQLNAEMMKLYKENGTSPFGACLPSLLQMPFLIVLYSLIRGLSYTVTTKSGKVIAEPRYIPTDSKMHANLVASGGHMHTWFGMDLSVSPWTIFHAHAGLHVIPYIVLIVAAIFLQYYQMKQMNSRNPQAAQANPQMQQMQKFFPIIFGVIYLRVPAGAIIYMVVSSAMRIGTQEIMFRTGMVTPVAATTEREIGGGAAAPKGDTPQKAIGTGKTGTGKTGTGAGKPAAAKPAAGTAKTSAKSNNAAKRTTSTNGRAQTTGKTGANSKAQANGARPTNGKSPTARASNGTNGSNDAAIEPVVVPKEHPRSRSKRTRKAR